MRISASLMFLALAACTPAEPGNGVPADAANDGDSTWVDPAPAANGGDMAQDNAPAGAAAAGNVAAALPDAYPTRAVLEAFRAACGDLSTPAKARAAIAAAGWEPLARPETTPVGKLVALGRKEGAAMLGKGDGKLGATRIYRRAVAGEELDLVFSEVTLSGYRVLGCRMYDFAETRPLSTDTAAEWIGRPPSFARTENGVARATWRPGFGGEMNDSLQLYFIPADSPAVRETGFSGIAVAADRAAI